MIENLDSQSQAFVFVLWCLLLYYTYNRYIKINESGNNRGCTGLIITFIIGGILLTLLVQLLDNS
jgi:hypothetical protein